MINDYLWAMLYAQRQADLRARARRRGGDPASSGSASPGPVRRLLVRLGLRRPPAVPATARPAITDTTAATGVTAGLVFPAPGVRAADRQPAPAAGANHEEAA
jgi:hypothetical protein